MADDRVEELLEKWGNLRRRGEDIPVEVLCRSCPELTAQVQRRIKALKATEWLDRPVVDEGNGPAETHPLNATPEAFHLPPTLGRYQLEHLIGVGGFGQVWRGFDPQLCRPVAIKVARPDRIATPEQTEKFLAEGRRIAQLRHPGIVPVYDVGQETGRCFIVSEFIEGGNLAEKIVQARPGPVEAARLVADVADALHHAHDRHIVHRDIKPSNILLDDRSKPFVADFGIALRTDEDRAAEQTTGTAAYMAWEQIRGEPVDARTDIYSLGVVLYELLTGKVPSAASNLTALRLAISSGQPPIPPRVLNRAVSAQLEKICLKAIAKNAAGRYPTAEAFSAALREAVVGQRDRRFRTVFLIGLFVLIACVGGWLVDHARHRPVARSAALSSSTQSAPRPEQTTAHTQAGSQTPLEVEITAEAKTLVAKLNAERQTQGLKPLTYNFKLAGAAQFHADWLARGGSPGHLEGDKPTTIEQWRASTWHPINRMVQAGYLEFGVLNAPDANHHAGELIAFRTLTSDADLQQPAKVAEVWINGSERETSMGEYQDIGIAVARTKMGEFWVAVFGNP